VTTTSVGRRIAVNPLLYWSKAGKTKEVFEEAFADFAKIATAPSRPTVPTA
jgi:inosose dehydratase